MNDCGCDIVMVGGGIIGEEDIVYCPTHAAAPALLEALEAVKKFFGYTTEMPFELWAEAEDLEVIVDQALAAAKGGE
jgi:hypothetical protein